MSHEVIGWEILMGIMAIVLNGEKGGAGILAAFIAFNVLAGATILIGGK